MKKQIFGAILACQLLAHSVGLANADEITSKEESTETNVKTKLTRDGGKTESPLNSNSTACSITGATDLEKSWGYGYLPKKLAVDGQNNRKAPLNDEGAQAIPVATGTMYEGKINLGVKNKSRQTGAWRLTAKTDFEEKLGEKAAGITFNSDKTVITDVYNGGTSAITDSELTAFNSNALTNTTDGAKLTLNKSETEVFKGIEGIVHNGFYNTQLKDCTVNIPNTRRIQNDNFNCKITWNLAKAPSAEEEKE